MSQRVALVTGGASGIGKAIVEALARQDFRVVSADLQTGDFDSTVSHNIDSISADLVEHSACERIVQETVKRYERIDVLVNNAGFQHVDPIADFPVDTWNRMIALMLTAPFLLTRYVWPVMQSQQWGRIINIASIHGVVASPYKSAYISAKHGLIGLTKCAALEGGEDGITVNAICPAYVATPLVENQIESQARAHDLSRDEVIEHIMLAPAAVKRLIKPEEIADFVLYLCSPSGSVITGASLMIDLGWTAR